MEQILKVQGLTKIYDNGRKAIDNLSFSVRKGEILGFLGPNGAGKSTTINILSTLLKADAGKIVYFNATNATMKQVKKKLGIVPQELAIYEDMSAFKNVEFFASLYGVAKKELLGNINMALESVGLLERKDELPSSFSGGMKRRLNIACAIAHNPELIIFDEPTVGIDPQSRNHILDSILKLRAKGATIIYTTHYMEEVQAICDRVLIMDAGDLLIEGPMKTVLSQFNQKLKYEITIAGFPSETVFTEISTLKGVKEAKVADETLFLSVIEASVLGTILVLLINQGFTILDVKKQENNLEEIFLSLTGKELRD